MRGGEGIMGEHHQLHHHRPVAPLKVPPPRSFSFSHSGFSPSPSLRSPFVSPSPTPKLRPRPPETPAWLTILLHTVPLYIAYAWLSSHSSSSSSTTIVFAFLALLGSALGFFGILQQQRSPWQGSSSSSGGGGRSMAAPPAQWGLLFANGLLIAASTLLKLEGVRSCGPLVALLAEYAGSVLGKFVLGDWASSSPGRIRGLLATAIALLLLAHGWTIESCSPLAIKERMNRKMSSGGKCGSLLLPLWAPMAAGVLSACAKIMSTRTSLRFIPRKRIHGIATICAAVLMLPLALLQLDTLALVQASAWWPMSSMILLGLAQSLRGDAHFEEKLLIPQGSPRHFAITCCCASLLELWFGLDISPLGFLACSALLAIGVFELSDPGNAALSLDAIAQHEAQASLWALVKGPVRLITSDAKSGKIAAFLAMNFAFMVVEFAFGFTSNSLGLVSDACHMLFDCAALAIGLYASYISKLQPSSGFGYGYGRFEVLSGYANAVFLVLVASLIVLESIERILDPPEISTESLLVVSLGGLLVNLVGLVFFHEEHHHSHGGSCSHDHSATTKPVQQKELSINLGCSSALQELSSSPATTGDSLAMVEKQVFHHHSHSCTQQHSDEQLKHRSFDHQHHQHSDHEQCPSSHHHHHSDHQHSPNHHENSAHSHHHQHSPDHHDNSHHPDHHSDHEQCSSSHHHTEHQHSPNQHENSAHQHQNSAHSHQSDHHHSPNHHENSAHQHHQHGNSAHSCEHHGHSLNHHSHADDEHHDHSHHHHEIEDAHHHHIDHNMRGIFLHVLADTLGSVGVVISTLLIKYKGWMFTDPACSIFISVMIIASVIPLLINSGEILLQRTPRSTQKRLKEALEKIRHLQGVQGLERLHVWSFTNNEIVGTLHLHASTGSDKSMLRQKVSRLLNNVGITDMTIQVEDM